MKAPADPRGSSRSRSLDGVRALAALSVLVYHCASAAGVVSAIAEHSLILSSLVHVLGSFCVCVFFALSGFLLFRERIGSILFDDPVTPLSHYVARRALRIYPAYWLALIGLVVLVGRGTGRQITFGVVTLTERSLTDAQQIGGLPVAWSLYIEVSFYVLVPILGALLSMLCRGRSRGARIGIVTVTLAMMPILAIVWVQWSAESMGGDPRLHFSIVPFLGWFVAGMALAMLVRLREGSHCVPRVLEQLADHPWWCWVAAMALNVLIALGRVAPNHGESTSQLQLRLLLDGLAAFLILLPLVLNTKDSRLRRFLGIREMVALGLISYGIYLWHLTFITFLLQHITLPHSALEFLSLLAATIPLSLLAAAISYRWIERPALSLAPSSPLDTASRSKRS